MHWSLSVSHPELLTNLHDAYLVSSNPSAPAAKQSFRPNHSHDAGFVEDVWLWVVGQNSNMRPWSDLHQIIIRVFIHFNTCCYGWPVSAQSVASQLSCNSLLADSATAFIYRRSNRAMDRQCSRRHTGLVFFILSIIRSSRQFRPQESSGWVRIIHTYAESHATLQILALRMLYECWWMMSVGDWSSGWTSIST